MNRRIRQRIVRSGFFFVAALTSISWAFGQGELRQVLFEEIQAVPQQLKGEWTIGDRKFTVDGDTMVSRSLPPKVGTVAVIEYFERDGTSIITRIQPLPIVAKDISDGPYVFWKDLNTAEVVTINKGKVERQVINDIQEPRQLKELSSSEKTITLDPEMPTTPRSSWDAPNRLLAISDMEGNYHNVLRFLQNNEVLDDDGHWNWGDGHLVLLGDLVDRGFMVTELMWLMRRLEREAEAAGGTECTAKLCELQPRGGALSPRGTPGGCRCPRAA